MGNNKKTVYKISVAAIMIALSSVLSTVKVWQMPLGGSVTLLSMLPVCLISITYGTAFAIAPCLLYGVIQMFLGNPFSWGLNAPILIGCILFDYIIAYGVLCFAGIFRKKGTVGILLSVSLACLLRFFSHFISGYVLWTNVEQFELFGSKFVNHPILYSLCYNGFYMLPELILTVTASVLLFKSKAIKNLISKL